MRKCESHSTKSRIGHGTAKLTASKSVFLRTKTKPLTSTIASWPGIFRPPAGHRPFWSNQFLTWTGENRSARTLEWCLTHIESFSEFIGRKGHAEPTKAQSRQPMARTAIPKRDARPRGRSGDCPRPRKISAGSMSSQWRGYHYLMGGIVRLGGKDHPF
jgi:hypothetical protein